jgi:hypothetical protein
MLIFGQIFTFFPDRSTSKNCGFGGPYLPYGSFSEFNLWIRLNEWSDVIRVISDDLRSIGSVFTSILARQSQTITILGNLGLLGVNDPRKLGWENVNKWLHVYTREHVI